MSTLSSSSTLAQIKAAYADNASYAEDGSAAKAAAFITACRLLLIKIPERARNGEAELQMNVGILRGELGDATQWLAANGRTGGAVVHADLRGFRD